MNIVEVAEELHAWMFVSIDTSGKVLVNTVTKSKYMTNTSKHVLIDPDQLDEDSEDSQKPAEEKEEEPKFESLACRFSSSLHPQKKKINDMVSLVAIGNLTKVLIFAITSNNS